MLSPGLVEEAVEYKPRVIDDIETEFIKLYSILVPTTYFVAFYQ